MRNKLWMILLHLVISVWVKCKKHFSTFYSTTFVWYSKFSYFQIQSNKTDLMQHELLFTHKLSSVFSEPGSVLNPTGLDQDWFCGSL